MPLFMSCLPQSLDCGKYRRHLLVKIMSGRKINIVYLWDERKHRQGHGQLNGLLEMGKIVTMWSVL